MLRIKLRHLPEWNRKRQENAHHYNELFGQSNKVIIPYEPSWTRSVYHLYVIRTHKRDDLQSFLSESGIGTGLHYPIPLHLQKAYSNSHNNAGDFPVSEKVAVEIVSLPMYPGLTQDQQAEVVAKIKHFLSL